MERKVQARKTVRRQQQSSFQIEGTGRWACGVLIERERVGPRGNKGVGKNVGKGSGVEGWVTTALRRAGKGEQVGMWSVEHIISLGLRVQCAWSDRSVPGPLQHE